MWPGRDKRRDFSADEGERSNWPSLPADPAPYLDISASGPSGYESPAKQHSKVKERGKYGLPVTSPILVPLSFIHPHAVPAENSCSFQISRLASTSFDINDTSQTELILTDCDACTNAN